MSIGARIPEGGAVRNKKTGTLLISHVDLLETSIVGIPANPRSWIDQVSKSIKSGPVVDDEDEPVEKDETPQFQFEVPETETIVASGTGGTETIVPVDAIEASDDTTDETTEPSQEALKSEPGTDGPVDSTEVVDAATEVLERSSTAEVPDEVRELFAEVHNSLAAATEQLIEADAERIAAEQRAATAEAERDEMRVNTENVIREVANLIDQVGKLPAGRQTSFSAIADTAASKSIDWASMGMAPEVIALLEQRSK